MKLHLRVCRENALFLESKERLGTISLYVTEYTIRYLAITVMERASKWLFKLIQVYTALKKGSVV